MSDLNNPDLNQVNHRRTRRIRPYPIHTLEDSLKVASAIQRSNRGLPIDPETLAHALKTTVKSSGFIMRVNSSAKYGLTEGIHNDPRIKLTACGATITSPTGNSEFKKAVADAARHPEVFDRFYSMLDGKALPEDRFAENLLNRELGIAPELSRECLRVIKANGVFSGILKQVEDSLRIELDIAGNLAPSNHSIPIGLTSSSEQSPVENSKIFLSHFSGSAAIDIVANIFESLNIPYALSGNNDTAKTEDAVGGMPLHRPVSSEISNIMRSCNSAVLMFGISKKENLMHYQLGAASVLYGDHIVLVTESSGDQNDQPLEFPSIIFDQDKPDEFGVSLLRALQDAGIINISV